jgi:DNA-binding transcriptional LysR family regulator
VTLELEISNTARIREQLIEGRVDLGLTEGLIASGSPQLEALNVEVFTHDEMVLVIAPSHTAR